MKLSYVKLKKQAILPTYATTGAAGADVHACLPIPGCVLAPKAQSWIPIGLSVEVPAGYVIELVSRSGQAERGIIVKNSPGIIDSDFRGEVKVLIENTSDTTIRIHDGERVAQMLLKRVEQVSWQREESLTNTKRGTRGFGSTGK